MKIQMTEVKFEKDPNTKTTYNEVDREVREITENEYNNIVSSDTMRMMRKWGGSETAQRNYTCRGYKVTKLISASPKVEGVRHSKTIRTFEFA